MKLLDIILKEISLVKSQKISVLLIFIYPLLAVALLGVSFSGMSLSQMQGLSVGVVNNIPFDSNITNQLSGEQKLNIIEYSDINLLKNSVKRGDLALGLVLKSKGEFSQIHVDMYYDNSSILSSKLFLDFAKVSIQSISVKKTQETLGEVWQSITSLGETLDTQKQQLNEFQLMLEEAETSIESLEEKLNAINMDEIEESLNSQKEVIEDFEEKNREFKSKLKSFKESFEKTKNQLDLLSQKIDEYDDELNAISEVMEIQKTDLDELISGLEALYNTSPEEEKQVILPLLNKAKNFRNNLEQWKKEIDVMKELISDVSSAEAKLNSKMSEAEILFEQLEKESESISTALSSSKTTISEMNDKLEVFRESINEVRDLIDESKKSKKEIEEKLNSSVSLITSFEGDFEKFSKIDPKVLSNPILFFEKPIFIVDPLGIIIANATAIVLVLTCMLLTSIVTISEKIENVSLRLRLSPTNKVTLLIGKIIGQLVIALLEAIIIFIVAIFAFGVNLTPVIFELLIATAIISTLFISLGVLIASFTKSQSTAMLTSLLLVVPMLFMSGIIIPIMFMKGTMQLLSSLLPLTLANQILIGVIVKQMPLYFMQNELILVIITIAILLVIHLLKKEKFD